jgi:hypothetical protein
MSILAVVTQNLGLYCELSNNPHHAHIWVCLATTYCKDWLARGRCPERPGKFFKRIIETGLVGPGFEGA